ncbi:MAG: hypothetical protein GX327_07130 [Epulopiscium sp.]|nr:hypothetical protein [Candidatus Epulonipiscium sp.]
MKRIRALQISYYINIFAAIALILILMLFYGSKIQNIFLLADIMLGIFSIIAIFLFGILCISNAVVLYRRGDLATLRQYMKVAKRGLIPFFIINFIYCAFLNMILFVASRGIFIIGPIPIMIIIMVSFTYLAVLFSSSYSIAFIIQLKKKDKLSQGVAFLNICLQLIFVLDIIELIYLLRRFRKENDVFIETYS